MSRVGKVPVDIPAGVTVSIDGLNIVVQGPKGQLHKKFAGDIAFSFEEKRVSVTPLSDTKQAKAMWGTARNIISNMVKGVSTGFTQELELTGVGYRAILKGKYVNLTLGKSHITKVEIPSLIQLETPKQNVITMASIDKELLGQFSSVLIKQRPPEPYKGKGIKRKGQFVQRKKGKKN